MKHCREVSARRLQGGTFRVYLSCELRNRPNFAQTIVQRMSPPRWCSDWPASCRESTYAPISWGSVYTPWPNYLSDLSRMAPPVLYALREVGCRFQCFD